MGDVIESGPATFRDIGAWDFVAPAAVFSLLYLGFMYADDRLASPFTPIGLITIFSIARIIGRITRLTISDGVLHYQRGSTKRSLKTADIRDASLRWTPNLDEYFVITDGTQSIEFHDMTDRSLAFRQRLGEELRGNIHVRLGGKEKKLLGLQPDD